LAFDEKS